MLRKPVPHPHYGEAHSGYNMVDFSPPETSWLAHENATFRATSLYFRYGSGFYDPESGLAELDASLSASANATDDAAMAIGWTPIEQWSTRFEWTGISPALAAGTYYVRVRAINRAGLESRAISGPLLVDLTPPLVNESLIIARRYQPRTDCLQVNWTGAFTDPESPIAWYHWHVGTTPQAHTNALSYYPASVQSACIPATDTLLSGSVYYLTVTAETEAHQFTTVRRLLVNIDTTPPTFDGPPHVGLALGLAPQFHTDLENISCSWYPASEVESPVVEYRVSVRDATDNGTHLANATVPGPLATRHTFTGLALAEGSDVYCEVTAVNAAGLEGVAQSITAHVTTTPTAYDGLIFDGCTAGQRTRWQENATTLCFSYEGFNGTAADPATGLSYQVGTSKGASDVVPLTACPDCAPGRLVIMNGLTLAGETTYYVTLFAQRTSGGLYNRSSPGLTVDTTPADPTVVVTQFHPFNAARAPLFLWWAGWDEAHSMIVDYEYRVMSLFAPREVLPWTHVGPFPSADIPTEGLVPGRYTLALRATNAVGLTSSWNVSAPFSIDDTPPASSGVIWMGLHCNETAYKTVHDPVLGVTTAVGACWERMSERNIDPDMIYDVDYRLANRPQALWATGSYPYACADTNTSASWQEGDLVTAVVTGINTAGLRSFMVRRHHRRSQAPPSIII
ncbi:hypothetical protein PAPYR_7667 [Paratrimastix pyriformis]|uniref:Fibronectin type-III domain-containing protein n=1 Tax=Paratrimastix pyriformis TaxID=342808 RepID=A0ABQ8UJH4_9EUKA|nr:hypothetical protein PAPYR_7667 [Paratrimastix pyriformis]